MSTMSAESRWLRMGSSFVGVIVCACGPIAAVPSDETSSGTTGSMPSSSTSTGAGASSSTGASVESSSDQTSGIAGTSTTATSEDSGSNDFIEDPDGGCLGCGECDVWADDCPAGDKCMPWANDGGSSWNAVRCSPIAEDAKDVGEPCTAEGSGVSGIDDCVAHAMCWDVDPETNQGTCVGFCSGSEANPSCSGPCDSCVIANEGVLILCLPSCDPLLQDCNEGQACWPFGNAFACAPHVQSDLDAGDACDWATQCPPGLTCFAGACASFCDSAVADACASDLPGTTCVPWFEPAEGPPCISPSIGVCAIPEAP